MLAYAIVIAVIFNLFLALAHRGKKPQLAPARVPVRDPRRIKR